MAQNVEVKLSGALFDGDAANLFEAYQGELERLLGERALDLVDANLEDSIRVNRHVYTSEIRMTQQDVGQVVDDGWGETNDLPYGLWLEGIGSRNAPVTIFEGYHSFERATETLNGEWEQTAYDLLDRYIAEVNG